MQRGLFFLVAALTALLNLGCSVFSALGNPGAAWALGEPASLSLIIRRAEVAQQTARHVERLLGDTGIDEKSKWTAKTALKKAEAEEVLKQLRLSPIYAEAPPNAKLRVVPAEARLAAIATLCPAERQKPSLVATLGKEMAEAYAEIAAQDKTIGELKAKRAEVEKDLKKKDLDASEKEELETKKADITKEIEETEAAFDPKVQKFLDELREAAAASKDKASPSLKVALVNLKRAVSEARMANSAAMIRYPLALPGIQQDVEASAKRIIADIVEEKTGFRPSTKTLSPQVKFVDGEVTLALNGVPLSALGSMSPGQVVSEATSRLVDYAKMAVTLVAVSAETQTLLGFEEKVLDAWIGGLGIDAASVPDSGEDINDLKVETDATSAAAAAAALGKSSGRIAGPRTPGGVVVMTCPGKPAPKKDKDGKGKDTKDAKGKDAKDKGGKKKK